MLRKHQDRLAAGLASDDAAVKWTMLMTAQGMAVLVQMHEHVVVTGPSNDLVARSVLTVSWIGRGYATLKITILLISNHKLLSATRRPVAVLIASACALPGH